MALRASVKSRFLASWILLSMLASTILSVPVKVGKTLEEALTVPQTHAAGVSCPVADGADGATDGIITISANTAWAPPTTMGDYWDCSTLDLRVTNSKTLAFNSTPTTGAYGYLKIKNLTIDSGSAITATSKGCISTASGTYYGFAPDSSNICTQGGTGAGAGSSNNLLNPLGGGGGAHGGVGGAGMGSMTGGATNDSLTNPLLFGSSGGAAWTQAGGAGGGIVRIEASGTATIDGQISANGAAGTNTTRGSGGGSGGSINLTVGTLAGSATTPFSATGGTGGAVSSSYYGGGGSGGRIAVSYTSTSMTLSSTSFSVSGGSAGGGSAVAGTNGTAYAKNTTASTSKFFGDLILDGSNYASYSFPSESLTFNTSSTQTCLSSATTPSISASTLTMGGTLTCTAATGLSTLTLSSTTGALNMQSGTVINANVTGSSLNMDLGAGTSSTWTGVTITGGTQGYFNIDDAADLTLAGSSTITANVNWTALANLNIGSSSSISANSLGCTSAAAGTYYGYAPNSSNVCTQGETGAGVGTSDSGTQKGGGGGGHGGAGGSGYAGTLAGGSTNDALTTPVFFGSSGGATYTVPGGTGGGRIRLNVTGTFTHNGAITANGSTYSSALRGTGGGSGGSIYVTVGTLAGSAASPFLATGAAGGAVNLGTNNYVGGGGGGGRISVNYTTDSSSFLSGLSSSTVVAGGASGGGTASAGSTGTLYRAQTPTIPSTPSITAPTDGATGVSRNPTLTTGAYSGYGSHVSSDWQVATDSGFSSIVWSSSGDTSHLTSIVVNSSQGTFAGTLSGATRLTPGTYYVRASHNNATGNSNWSSTISFTATNTVPTVSSVSPVQKTNGSGIVDLSFIIDDADDDDIVKAKVEVNTGSGWTAATLDTTDANTTATYGDPKIDNAAAYQVGTSLGYITTSSGANTVNVDLAASNFTGVDSSSVQVRVTPTDLGGAGTAVTSSAFTVDAVAPTSPSPLTNTSSTQTSATLTWTASTESHFDHYNIWYGTSNVNILAKTSSVWTVANQANLATSTTATATITGLNSSTTYRAMICALDTYGYETCVTPTTAMSTTAYPVASSLSHSEATDASGKVTLSFAISHADSTASQVKLEYSVDGGSTWGDPTLSTDSADLTATHGTPTLNNAATYQVQAITTSSGVNTITVVWLAATDLPSSTSISNARFRVTPYDGAGVGTVQSTSNFILDLKSPSAPGSFASPSHGVSSAYFTWTASTEDHFNHYEIWYGTNQTDVEARSGTAAKWDNTNDSNLSTRTTLASTVTGLSENTVYYALICAVDDYGYTACSTPSIDLQTGSRPVIGSVEAVQKTDGSKTVDVTFTMSDLDGDNSRAKIELYINGEWVQAALDTTDANTTASSGDPKVNNAVSYQLGTAAGYILTSSSPNTIQFDLPVGNFTSLVGESVQIRITPNDGSDDGIPVTQSFSVDIVDPTTSTLSLEARNHGRIYAEWTQSTEAHFNHYEVWYGQSSTDVAARTGTASVWDNDPEDPNLANITQLNTIVTGLSQGELYYMMLCALDDHGNRACSTVESVGTGLSPSISIISATERSDASDLVDVVADFIDGDNETDAKLKVEIYVDGAWIPAILETADASTTAQTGDPKVDNNASYQIGTAAGYILTSSVANRINFILSASNFVGMDGEINLRLTPNDGTDDGDSDEFLMTIDALAPTLAGNFSVTALTSSTADLGWQDSSDANFDHYSVWYGSNQSDVVGKTGSAIERVLGGLGTTSVTLNGLTQATDYYTIICSYDTFAHETCSSPALSFRTTSIPVSANLAGEEIANQYGDVSLSFDVSDADSEDLEVSVIYTINNETWAAATLSEAPSDVNITYGAKPSVSNLGAYQITGIKTNAGTNTLTVTWQAAEDLPSGTNVSTAKVRITVRDTHDTASPLDSSTFDLDLRAPTAPSDLSRISYTSTTATLSWGVSTESHFNHYTIWYGTNQSDVLNQTGTALAWDDQDDATLASLGTTQTTLTGLTGGTTYYANICAKDNYGFESCGLSALEFLVGSTPIVSNVLAEESTEGLNRVPFSVDVEEEEAYPTQLKVEYSIDAGATWHLASLSTNGADLTADYGTPTLHNGSAYNIQDIDTNSGINTINAVWTPGAQSLNGTDIEDALLRVTPYNGVTVGSAVSSDPFILDLLAPTEAQNLALVSASSSMASLSWTPSTETHFSAYKICYGTSQSDVLICGGTASIWDSNDDAQMATKAYSQTTITNLESGTSYYGIICAADDFGHEVCGSSALNFQTSGVPVASMVAGEQASAGRVNLSFHASDLEGDTLSAKIEYSVDSGTSWSEATLSTEDTDTASSPVGDPSVDNNNLVGSEIYQIFGIQTNSGASTVQTVWLASEDLPSSTDLEDALIRVTLTDETNVGIPAQDSFILDLKAPTNLADFVLTGRGLSSANFSWSAPSETHFSSYTIWYGEDQAQVALGAAGSASAWDSSDDENLLDLATVETVIGALSPSTSYYAMLCASDVYGNESCTSTLTFGSGSLPVASNMEAAQRTDGSKLVDLGFEFSDGDGDDHSRAKIEINTGAGWVAAVLATADELTTATYGDPSVDNQRSYQLGVPGGYIITSSGTNTIQTVLDDSNFVGVESNNVQIRITPNDGSDDGTPIEMAINVDAIDPTSPSNLSHDGGTQSEAILSWAQTLENHFDHYELWYGTNRNAVIDHTSPAILWSDPSFDEQDINTESTTLTGLTRGQTYYVSLCAFDTYGNTNCSGTLQFVNNNKPSVAGSSISAESNREDQRRGVMLLEIPVVDTDEDEVGLVIEYRLGSGVWHSATLIEGASENDGSSSEPTVDNSAPYPVQLATNSGSNTIHVRWDAYEDIGEEESGDYQIRITPNDTYESGDSAIVTVELLDTLAPQGLDHFGMSTSTSDSITWAWDAATDLHFLRYEIWYGTDEEDVRNHTGTAQRWDTGNDAALGFASTQQTRITGLQENTDYYAILIARDSYLNWAQTSLATANNNGRPTLSDLSAVQRSDGTFWVDVDFTIDDVDNEDTLRTTLEYNIGGGWEKATLQEGSVSATTGSPALDNAADQQIGTASGYIETSGGANTIHTVWLTDEDLTEDVELTDAQFRIIPYDAAENGAPLSTFFMLDTLAPRGLDNLQVTESTSSNATLTWTAVNDELNFSHYEIWYSTNMEGTLNRDAQNASMWDESDDGTLDQMNTSGTTIEGLTQGSHYYFTIFAIDSLGNNTMSGPAELSTNGLPTVYAITANEATDASGVVTIQMSVSDADEENVDLQIEYNLGDGWFAPTLDTAAEAISVDFGTTPTVDNEAQQQVAGISTQGGDNVLTVHWLSAQDEPHADVSNALIRVTPFDGAEFGNASSGSEFTVDNVAPVGLDNLSASGTTTRVNLAWSAVTDESNFDTYQVWYGTVQSDVVNREGAATLVDRQTFSSLGTMSTHSLRLDLNPDQNYFIIFAVDAFGNTSHLDEQFVEASEENGGGEGGGNEGSGGSGGNEGSNQNGQGIPLGLADQWNNAQASAEEAANASEEDLGNNAENSAEDSIANMDLGPTVSPENNPWTLYLPDDWSQPYMQAMISLQSVVDAAAQSSIFHNVLLQALVHPQGATTRQDCLALLMSISGVGLENKPEAIDSFWDVNSETPGADFIEYAAEQGLVTGYKEGDFRPKIKINRAEALKLIYTFVLKKAPSAQVDYAMPFPDVARNTWYAPYVYQAYRDGLIKGYEDGTLGPSKNVTYEEFIKMVTLALNKNGAVAKR